MPFLPRLIDAMLRNTPAGVEQDDSLPPCRDAWQRVGEFDESFFAHMEEIDLNWRLHLAGRRVLFCPQAVVQHNAGTTLPPEHPRKIFLNHRNGLVMS